MVEQLICNQQVGGSSPSTGSTWFTAPAVRETSYGGIPEWPKGADCKSVSSAFGGSNPPSPTKTKKSELDSDRIWVRIFCFYQRHYILMITPRGLNMSSGFFCCAPGGCILYCCWAAFRYGNLFQCYKNEEAEMGNTDGADVHADDIRLLQVHRKQPRPIRFFLYCAKK